MNRLLCLVGIGLLGVLASASLASADRGLYPAEPAGTYMTAVVKQKLRSDYAAAWQTLYPPHQRIATLEAYVGCESLMPAAGTLLGVRVLRTFDERITIAGRKGKLLTRAVRIRVSVASPLYTAWPVSITQTFHAIAVEGQWRWILSPDQYAYYSAGTCPYG